MGLRASECLGGTEETKKQKNPFCGSSEIFDLRVRMYMYVSY